MKQIHIMVICLSFYAMNAFTQTSFAILPMESKDVPPAIVEEAFVGFNQRLIESGRYRIIDRQRIKQVLEEQALQLSGVVDSEKMIQIGKLLGVEKIIASSIYMKETDQFTIHLTVTDIATAQIEFSHEEIPIKGYSASSCARFCASKILKKYPLIGKILGSTGEIFIVNLGSNHGLNVGNRLFVAHNEILRGDNSEVLFQEYQRIGLLEVIKLDAMRAQAKIRFLEDAKKPCQKDDLVSPDPIPAKEPVVSPTPLLPNIEKGKLLLDDDMEKQQYLTVRQGQGEDYAKGKLHLNAIHKNTGWAYCFYPIPFDMFSNFIVEMEAEIPEVENNNSGNFIMVFRSNGLYDRLTGYYLSYYEAGLYAVYEYLLGDYNQIIPLQSSPLFNRGKSKNGIKIIAFESQFDIYINNQFLVGYEHETFEKGSIGFFCKYGGYAIVDNLKIWEAVKRY